jgi:cerevisin
LHLPHSPKSLRVFPSLALDPLATATATSTSTTAQLGYFVFLLTAFIMVKVISLVALTALLPYVSALFIPSSADRFHTGPEDYEAPIHTSSNAKTIENQYIVVFHPHAADDAIAAHHTFLQTTLLAQPPRPERDGSTQQPFGWHNPLNDLFGMVKHTYNITNKLKGYSGMFSPSAIDILRKDPNIAYIEQDQEVHICAQEKNAPWGLARLSHKESLGFSTFNKYDYDARGGKGVTGKCCVAHGRC